MQAAGLSGRDIICVGFADWETDLWTNQHHLMSRLAIDNRVLFVESLGLRRPQLTVRDLRRLARRLRRGLASPRRVLAGDGDGSGLFVLSPLVIPLHGRPFSEAINNCILSTVIPRQAARLGMRAPILWSYVPQAQVLAMPLRPSCVVYHCVDNIAAQKGVNGAAFRAAERRFIPLADIVLSSAPESTARLSRLHARVIDTPNVADTALFATALEPGQVDASLAGLPHPRIVFAGALVATKLDLDLLIGLARARRSWSFVLVGPVGPGDPGVDLSALAAETNIHLLGPRRHVDLPKIFRGADVGLIPYVRNELTASVFPLKLYEYLSAGLPVVATSLPALRNVEDVVIADNVAETVSAIETILAHETRAKRAARSRRATPHSWEGRIAQIAQLIGT